MEPQLMARTNEDETTRSIVSDIDRRRPSVRLLLGGSQALILIGLLVVGLGPLLWLFKAALSTSQDILRDPFGFFPSGVQWGNLAEAWTTLRIGPLLFNTAVIALGAAVVSLIVCTTVAYVLSVLRPAWGPILSGAILATLFIPAIVVLVPLYLTILDLPLTGGSLMNNYLALWLPAAANAFNILVVRRFFDTIPRELYEAARMDGAGPVRVFFAIVLPLSRPILGVIALLAVIASWKDFLWPLLVIQNVDLQPISVALPLLTRRAELSVQMAALFLAVIIPVALFLVFQRQILRGVGAAGGIKE
jgi:multiple sugar transport system permease protein